jgi:phthalate 4,5-dioxygenase oxygenase subunit
MAKLKSYPTALRGGVVWIYMGPADAVAAPPDFEWSLLPERQRTATKRLQSCNWAQAVDGGIDSSHISFLHSRTKTQKRNEGDLRDIALKYWQVDRHPVFELKETPCGFMIGARRNLEGERCYWRITQFLLPFYTMVPPRNETDDSRDAFFFGHAWVPIDDENTWTWSFSVHPTRPFTELEHEWHGGRGGFWGPTDENFLPLYNKDNDYLIDREKQRTQSFSGIEGIPNQDSAVQESMGPIVDRSLEVLGHSDRAVVRFRRMLIQLAEDCAAGKPIEATAHPEWYKIRSASVILKNGEAFDEGAAWLVAGAQREAAE